MMKKRFTEAQIVGFFKEADAGLSVKTLAGAMASPKAAITCGGASLAA
jgi:hypothetical protein